jgi:hypothetical protein
VKVRHANETKLKRYDVTKLAWYRSSTTRLLTGSSLETSKLQNVMPRDDRVVRSLLYYSIAHQWDSTIMFQLDDFLAIRTIIRTSMRCSSAKKSHCRCRQIGDIFPYSVQPWPFHHNARTRSSCVRVRSIVHALVMHVSRCIH